MEFELIAKILVAVIGGFGFGYFLVYTRALAWICLVVLAVDISCLIAILLIWLFTLEPLPTAPQQILIGFSMALGCGLGGLLKTWLER